MVLDNRAEVRVTPGEDGFEVRFGGGDEGVFPEVEAVWEPRTKRH